MAHFREMLSYGVSKKSFFKKTYQKTKKHSDLESGTL